VIKKTAKQDVYSNRLKWTCRKFLKYEIQLHRHAEVTGAPEESAVRTVWANWTHGELVWASHRGVCVCVRVHSRSRACVWVRACERACLCVCVCVCVCDTSLLDDTHSPLHRIVSCWTHTWSLSEPSTVIITLVTSWFVPFIQPYYALHTWYLVIFALWDGIDEFLAWSEAQFGDRLTNWKTWNLNILLYLKVVTPCVF